MIGIGPSRPQSVKKKVEILPITSNFYTIPLEKGRRVHLTVQFGEESPSRIIIKGVSGFREVVSKDKVVQIKDLIATSTGNITVRISGTPVETLFCVEG